MFHACDSKGSGVGRGRSAAGGGGAAAFAEGALTTVEVHERFQVVYCLHRDQIMHILFGCHSIDRSISRIVFWRNQDKCYGKILRLSGHGYRLPFEASSRDHL